MPKSVSQKILRNTSFNIFARMVHMAAYLVIIPVIINNVGQARYGIWVILFAFVDYFSLLDLGFGAATVKYTADHYAQNDIFRVGQTVITALLFHLFIVPVIVIPVFFAENIINLFNVSPENMGEAIFVLRGVLLIFAFSQVTSVFRNLLIGLQLIDIQSLCDMVNTLLYAVGGIIVVKAGLGLKGLVLLTGGLRILLVVAHAFFVFKRVPQMKSGLIHFNAKMLKEFFKYGVRLQVTSFAGLFNFQLDKLLIGYFLRMEMVAFYDLGSKIAMLIRQIPSVLLSPLIPASAELSAKADRKRLEAMHLQGAKYLILMAAPIAAFLIAMAPSVMTLWIGKNDHSYAVLALRILSIGYFFNIITGVVTSMGRGMGILYYEMNASCFIALSNLFLSLLLIMKMGFIGVLIGTSISMTVGNVVYFYRFNRYLGTAFMRFVKDALIGPVFFAVLAGGIIWVTQDLVGNSLILTLISRMEIMMYLGFAGVFFLVLYGGGLVLSGCLGRLEVQLIGETIRSLCRVL